MKKRIFNIILMITTILLCGNNADRAKDKVHAINHTENNMLISTKKAKSIKNDDNISYVDNYIEQYYYGDDYEGISYPDDVNMASTPRLISSSNGTYTDNGHTDDKPTGATKIDPKNSTIVGTLNKNDWWTQFTKGVGERDEDYFRFSTKEKLLYTFTFENPSDYYLRILRFSEKHDFVCSSQGNFSIELDPATYFIHIYSNNTDTIVSDEYKISYNTERISNNNSFEINDSTLSKYQMVLWENEIWPNNSKRWVYKHEDLATRMKTRNSEVSTGYIDPIFSNGENDIYMDDEIYIDSALIIFDKQLVREVRKLIEKLYADLYETLTKKDVEEVKIEQINDGANFILNFISLYDDLSIYTLPITLLNIAYPLFNFIFYNYFTFTYTLNERALGIDFLTYLKGLMSACTWMPDTVNAYLVIPQFYTIKNRSIQSSKYIKESRTTRISYVSTNLFKDSIDFKYKNAENKINNVISVNDFLEETTENYTKFRGKITAFQNTNELKEYISTGADVGDAGDNVDFHDYKNPVQIDSENHLLTCSCGKTLVERHSYSYINDKYICEYCGYEQPLCNDHIELSLYDFDSQYHFDEKSKSIITPLGNNVMTNRLRCGIIENKLTMSAKRHNAGKSYLEYHFEKEIIKLDYKLALWSDNESLIENSSIRIEAIGENNEWYTIRKLDARKMTTYSQGFTLYSDTFDFPIKSFRFIIETNEVANENNRGRMVIGDIDFTYIDN